MASPLSSRKRPLPVEYDDVSSISAPTDGPAAKVHGVVTALSPIKPTSNRPYFEGYLSDGSKKIRFVGFSSTKEKLISKFNKVQEPVLMSNCSIKNSRFGEGLEIIVGDNATIEKSDKEWRQQLTPEQFRITRQKGTERPHSGALCSIYDAGLYNCVCCNTPLFDSTIKFESGTGWPSFTQPIKPNAIKYEKDSSFGMVRVEVMCNTCHGHLGHVFPDGPEPSGLRYCINSESMVLDSSVKETN